MKICANSSEAPNCADCSPKELMEDVNGTYFGRHRWFFLGLLFAQLCIIVVVAQEGNFQSLNIGGFIFMSVIIIGALTISLSGTISSWKDWQRRKKRLIIVKTLLSEYVSPSIYLLNEKEESWFQDKMHAWSKGQNYWLLLGVFGEVILFLIFWSTGLLKMEQSAENFFPALVLGLWWPVCLTQVFINWKRIKNLKGGKNGSALLEILVTYGCPYVLYLRNFESEDNPLDALPKGPDFPPDFKISERERDLLTVFADFIPIFTMTNYQDFGHDPTAIRLNMAGMNWQEKFRWCAVNAAVIVVRLGSLSKSILYELRWIKTSPAAKRTLIVCSSEVLADLQLEDVNIVSSIRWIVTHEDNSGQPTIPSDLTCYLADLGDKQNTITIGCLDSK